MGVDLLGGGNVRQIWGNLSKCGCGGFRVRSICGSRI